MKCNYCRKKASIAIKQRFENVNYYLYCCRKHSYREIMFWNNITKK
ncbi:hypothetical protein [Spiroplasma endosymbiont of Amphimallon solstitiale]